MDRGVPIAIASVGLALSVRLLIADVWAAKSDFLTQQGRLQEAIAALGQSQQWDSLSSKYPCEAGERLIEQWNTQAGQGIGQDSDGLLLRARAQFERAAILSPWFGPVWLRLAQIHWRLGDVEKALYAMRQAMRYNPNSRGIALQLADLLHATGHFEELQLLARQAQARKHSSPRWLRYEAIARMRLQKVDPRANFSLDAKRPDQ